MNTIKVFGTSACVFGLTAFALTAHAASFSVGFQATIGSEGNPLAKRENGSNSEGGPYYVSVNPNNAGYASFAANLPGGSTAAPAFQRSFPHPVLAWTWVGGGPNNVLTQNVRTDGSGLITYSTTSTSFDGFAQDQLTLWVTSDPGPDLLNPATPRDFTGPGYRGAFVNCTGIIDISGLGSGTVYVFYGDFRGTPNLTAVMKDTDGGAPDITIEEAHLNGDFANRAEYYCAELEFEADGIYDEIEFVWTGNGDSGGNGRFGGSVLTGSPPTGTLALTDFSYDAATGAAEVSIEGSPASAYVLVEADDLDFGNPDQNPVPLISASVGTLDGDQVTTDGEGNATVQFNLGTAKPATFIRAEDAPPPPPLLDEDFESGLPGTWVASDNGAGTAWSVGTPNGTSTEPDSAANGTQSAGTNMNGNYTDSASASLVSPSFVVPAGGATLSFSQYIDTEAATGGQDFGSIRLLNASDDSPLTGGEVAGDLQGISEAWTSESLPLPAAANGLEVKIEFLFQSDDDGQVFAGFYIDDVLVTAN